MHKEDMAPAADREGRAIFLRPNERAKRPTVAWGLVCCIVLFCTYAHFVLCAAYDPRSLAALAYGGHVTVAFIEGAVVIAAGVLLTCLYAIVADRIETMKRGGGDERHR